MSESISCAITASLVLTGRPPHCSVPSGLRLWSQRLELTSPDLLNTIFSSALLTFPLRASQYNHHLLLVATEQLDRRKITNIMEREKKADGLINFVFQVCFAFPGHSFFTIVHRSCLTFSC
ncbi:hypothetical protein PAMP_024249 [Pampus punctatissimus]